MLTNNQKAILKRIANNTHTLENCVGGYALWDKSIHWGQGRTPRNAISQGDIDHLIKEGYLEKADFGDLRIIRDKFYECLRFDNFDFVPANEGYRGMPMVNK